MTNKHIRGAGPSIRRRLPEEAFTFTGSLRGAGAAGSHAASIHNEPGFDIQLEDPQQINMQDLHQQLLLGISSSDLQ